MNLVNTSLEYLTNNTKMSNFFSDIDAAWKGKQVEFVSGKYIGKTGVCNGFVNYYKGAGLLITCDDGNRIVIYSRDLDNLKIIKEDKADGTTN